MKHKLKFLTIIAGGLLVLAGLTSAAEIEAEKWVRENLLPEVDRGGWYSTFSDMFKERTDLGRSLSIELAKQTDVGSLKSAFLGLTDFGKAEDKKLFETTCQRLSKLLKNENGKNEFLHIYSLIFQARELNDLKAQKELIELISKYGSKSGNLWRCFHGTKWGADALADIAADQKLSDDTRLAAWLEMFQNKEGRALELIQDINVSAGMTGWEISFGRVLGQIISDDRLRDYTDKQCLEYLTTTKDVFKKFRSRDKVVGEVDWKKLLAEKPPQ